MHCPVCKTANLVVHDLDANLTSHQCPQCGGQWVSGERYRAWQSKHAHTLSEMPAKPTADPPIIESDKPKLCPECGHILLPYRIDQELPFSLDHCGHCGGTWFDRNEWETLKSRGLHEEAGSVFTEVWQANLRHAESHRAYEQRQRDKFGDEGWTEIQRVKAWIDAHPLKAEIHAYLLHGEQFPGE